MSDLSCFLHGISHAKHIGNLSQCQYRALIGNSFLYHVHRDGTVSQRFDVFKHRALCLADHLPGQDVGMMLHHADNYLIAGFHFFHAVAVRHQIYGLGGITDKYYLRIISCIDKTRRPAP